MKKGIIISISLTIMLLCGCDKAEEAAKDVPVTDCIVKITPVKDQGHSSFCWIYAMLATIESDRLMLGDSVNLSADYVAYRHFAQQAEAFYVSGGANDITMRGMAPRALSLISDYGLTHHDAYNTDADMKVVERTLRKIVSGDINRRAGIEKTRKDITDILDNGIRPLPQRVYLLGAQYSPHEFARSVCLPDDYIALTSYTHKPFGEMITLDVADNYGGERFLNMPVDSLQSIINRTLRSGHAVCWEGDISESGFSFADGYARLNNENEHVTQERRQRSFETFRTTDDHCMEIIGMAHDGDGRKYYICKNSYGTGNPFGGLMYMSENYLRMKTIAVVIKKI